MKPVKREKLKMLLFARDIHGYSVNPFSVVAWLCSEKAPKLAEDFALAFTRIRPKLEKEWQEKMRPKDTKDIS